MKKHSILLFLYLPLLCLYTSACVTSSVSSRPNAVTASGANPSSLRTYSWYQERPKAQVAYDKEYNANLNQHLRKAIEEELGRKGLTKVTDGKPDILVAYDVSVSVPVEKDNPANFADGFGYSYSYMAGYRYSYKHTSLPGYRSVDLYKNGTLIIDFVDPKTNELIWRGWTEGAISNFKASYNSVLGEVSKVLQPLSKK